MAYNPKARIQVLRYLQQVGHVGSPDGRATAKLRRACGYAGGMTGLAGLLRVLERQGLIQRTINGKRCYDIVLVADVVLPEEEQPPLPTDGDRPSSTSVQPEADACADIEMPRRLATMHELCRTLEGRLARAKQELADTGEALKAARVENSGLRERLRQAEANIERLQRGVIDIELTPAEERLDRLMRERPVAAGRE